MMRPHRVAVVMVVESLWPRGRRIGENRFPNNDGELPGWFSVARNEELLFKVTIWLIVLAYNIHKDPADLPESSGP